MIEGSLFFCEKLNIWSSFSLSGVRVSLLYQYQLFLPSLQQIQSGFVVIAVQDCLKCSSFCFVFSTGYLDLLLSTRVKYYVYLVKKSLKCFVIVTILRSCTRIYKNALLCVRCLARSIRWHFTRRLHPRKYNWSYFLHSSFLEFFIPPEVNKNVDSTIA